MVSQSIDKDKRVYLDQFISYIKSKQPDATIEADLLDIINVTVTTEIDIDFLVDLGETYDKWLNQNNVNIFTKLILE